MAIRKYVGDKITGLSSDTKPSNVSDGATFYETDTLKIFIRVSGTWSEVPTGGSFSGCRVYKSAVQSITSSLTVVTFDLENYDTDTYHDNVTNNSRLTVPADGYYHITAVAPTSSNTASRARLRVDGTTVIAASGDGNAGASTDNGPSISTDYYLTAGQYVELQVAYVSTTSDAQSGVGGTHFAIHKIG